MIDYGEDITVISTNAVMLDSDGWIITGDNNAFISSSWPSISSTRKLDFQWVRYQLKLTIQPLAPSTPECSYRNLSRLCRYNTFVYANIYLNNRNDERFEKPWLFTTAKSQLRSSPRLICCNCESVTGVTEFIRNFTVYSSSRYSVLYVVLYCTLYSTYSLYCC